MVLQLAGNAFERPPAGEFGCYIDVQKTKG